MSGIEVPKVISVDDHVVEPPHLWQTWLPQKYREKGPRIETAKWEPFVHMAGTRYENTMDDDGIPGDYWLFEDKVIYVHKRFVAIPHEATPGGDISKFDRTVMEMTPVTYDEIRPGCYDRDARVEDFALNWVDGSLRLSAQLLGRDNSVLVKNRRSAAGFGVALFGFCLSVRRG